MDEALSVLVIEDDDDHRDLLSTVIRERGHRVIVAATAREALAAASGVQFDLMFIDVGLPDLTGYELVDQLRASGVRCRIVITTAYGDRRTRQTAARAGVDGFLLKPFPVAGVVAELERTLASR